MKLTLNKVLGVFFIIAVAIGLYLINENAAENTLPSPQESTIVEDDDTPVTDNSQFEDPEEIEEPEEDEPSKLPEPTVSVLDQPVIFTGFGNSSERPLGLEQSTSTTCTTDPEVECTLTFTNQETAEEVVFDAQTTDSTGVTRWEWRGADVGTGAWDVVGSAGDKTSDTGVVYIQ